MRIPAVIIDDEERARKALSSLLAKQFPHVDVLGMADGVASGLELLSIVKPLVLFLDIELDGRSGFDLLEALGNERPHVVFTTAHEGYAVRAIRSSALDYLLKPIDPHELGVALGKVVDAAKPAQQPEQFLALLQNMAQPSATIKRIALPVTDGLVMVDVEEILYCEGDGHYTTISLVGKKPIVISRNLGQVEDLLDPELFVRIHHARVVGLKHVSKYVRGDGGEVVMADGSHLSVSKRKKQDLMDRLARV